MNLEELISKYLDGEMTVQEDEVLRGSLSADATARLKFDSAVNLHLAMKEDAESIFPPDELLAQTEDMILMKILAKAPETQRKRAAIWSYTPMLAAMIAFFMLVSVFEISDFSQLTINNEQLTIHSSKVVNLQTAEGKQLTIVNNKLKTQNSKPATNNRQPMIENIMIADGSDGTVGAASGSGSYLSANIPLQPVEVSEPEASNEEILDIPPAVTNRQDIANSFSLSAIANNDDKIHVVENHSDIPNKVNVEPLMIDLGIPLMNDITNTNDVQVASFFGTDIARGGINVNDAVISHFSQSVAYAVDEDERYGVEVGFTGYTFIDKGTVNVEVKFGGTTGVESYEGGNNFSIGYPQDISLKSDKQLLWASAFYENTFLNYNGLSFTGRLGVGGMSEGPLGYSRIFALYSLFNGLYITLGAEGRLFSAEFSKFSENEDKFKTSASLIYGLQFKF